MDPFYDGPLRPLTNKLRAAYGGCETPALPEAFADTGELGRLARNFLTELPPREQEIVATFCARRLAESRWVRSHLNREVAKVVLDEVSVTAAGPAQELGLAFTSALSRVEAPWMRILVNLELAELLSRAHMYAPSCAIAYLQTFRLFDDYLRRGDFAKGPRTSLFEPIALAGGHEDTAKVVALQAVLPYGEDALRLLWGLQARDQQDGNIIGLKVLRAEEIELGERLRSWLTLLDASRIADCPSWRANLETALERCAAAAGPEYIRLKATPRSNAAGSLVDDARSLLESSQNNEAHRSLTALFSAVSKDSQRDTTTMREHHLEAGYLLAIATYRVASHGRRPRPDVNEVRRMWTDLESHYNEIGSLWSRKVVDTRLQAIKEIPKEWRFAPLRLPV